MTRRYKIQLLSHFNTALNESELMVANGIGDALAATPGVRLIRKGPDDVPERCDVSIIHSPWGSSFHTTLFGAIRRRSRVLLDIREGLLPDDFRATLDCFYTFGEPLQAAPAGVVPKIRYLPPPYDRRVYPEWPPQPSTGLSCKILLDHDGRVFPAIAANPARDVTAHLWEFFRQRPNYYVGQLQRLATEKHPAWICLIPRQEIRGYLREMRHYDTFIVTHHGSFNHSAKDAALLGLRVLVPIYGGCGPYVPKAMVEQLGLETFATAEELQRLLAKPCVRQSCASRCMDFAEIAQLMLQDAQALLGEPS